ncbi:MAG: hypothetical protein M3081_14335 [Gemmatimonadota bacterium]|nr:hypothetical protein [Gemmatimonadota bacterium]
MTDEKQDAPAYRERRRNERLRALVDEMMASIRIAAKQDLWTPDERQRYEKELDDIMSRVRNQAVTPLAAAPPGAASDVKNRTPDSH